MRDFPLGCLRPGSRVRAMARPWVTRCDVGAVELTVGRPRSRRWRSRFPERRGIERLRLCGRAWHRRRSARPPAGLGQELAARSTSRSPQARVARSCAFTRAVISRSNETCRQSSIAQIRSASSSGSSQSSSLKAGLRRPALSAARELPGPRKDARHGVVFCGVSVPITDIMCTVPSIVLPWVSDGPRRTNLTRGESHAPIKHDGDPRAAASDTTHGQFRPRVDSKP